MNFKDLFTIINWVYLNKIYTWATNNRAGKISTKRNGQWLAPTLTSSRFGRTTTIPIYTLRSIEYTLSTNSNSRIRGSCIFRGKITPFGWLLITSKKKKAAKYASIDQSHTYSSKKSRLRYSISEIYLFQT
jgi:hypothetical protein